MYVIEINQPAEREDGRMDVRFRIASGVDELHKKLETLIAEHMPYGTPDEDAIPIYNEASEVCDSLRRWHETSGVVGPMPGGVVFRVGAIEEA